MSPFTVPAGSDSDIPVGQHTVEITGARDGGVSRNGNEQIVIDLQDRDGRVLSDWITLSPRALWRAQQIWEAAGLHWPGAGENIDEHDLIGRHVHITVYEDEYEGRRRNKVQEYGAPVQEDIPSPVDDLPPSPDRKQAFAAAAADKDEDIPF